MDDHPKVIWSDPTTSDLLYKALKLQVSACNCLTKTPDPKYHDSECKYRMASEIYDGILSLRNQLEVERNTIVTVYVGEERKKD